MAKVFLRHKKTGIVYDYSETLAKNRANVLEVYTGDPDNPPPLADDLDAQAQTLMEEAAAAANPPVVEPHDPDAEESVAETEALEEGQVDEVGLFEAIDALDSMEAAAHLASQFNYELDATDLDQAKAELLGANLGG